MKVISLKLNPKVYSSKSYLILGSWNCIEDVNTLVDTGNDLKILDEIEKINTGVGKKPVDQIILTHNHFDHTGAIKILIKRFNPVIYSFTKTDYTTSLLIDRQMLKIGDRGFEVIHTPGHSNDSICLYCKEEKVLFSGDTPLNIKSPGGSYMDAYVYALERINKLDISIIYSGHDDPVIENVKEMLSFTLKNVRSSTIIP